MTESPYYTLIASPDAVITDAQGNVWSILSGQVAENGIPDPTTANVIALVYAPTGYATAPDGTFQAYGQVWQENASRLWWAATDAGWSPPYGISSAPVGVSASNTVITPGEPAAILDLGQNIWSIIGGQVARNGVVDPTTANVIGLDYKNGVVWQENAAHGWWSYSQAANGSSLWTPGNTPAARSWIGGGDNNVSNPNDWWPNGAPTLVDTLSITPDLHGPSPLNSVLNVYGNALAGDTLHIYFGSTSTQTINLMAADASILTTPNNRSGHAPPHEYVIDINASGGTSNLSLNVYGDTVNVQVAPDSTLVMNDTVGLSNLTVSGGTIKFIGDNLFGGFKTVLNDRLVGTATITETTSDFLEVSGSVSCGLTFNLSAYAYSGASNLQRDIGLQIDHPEWFHGTINTMDGFVAFMGLHATRGEILNGMLELFDCDRLVDKTRFTGNPNGPGDVLQLEQTSAGVMLSNGIAHNYQPGGIGTALPLTIPS